MAVALPMPKAAAISTSAAYTPVALSMSSSNMSSPHVCSGKRALSKAASSFLSNSPFPSSSYSSHQRSSFACCCCSWRIRFWFNVACRFIAAADWTFNTMVPMRRCAQLRYDLPREPDGTLLAGPAEKQRLLR